MEQRDEELVQRLIPEVPELKLLWDEHKKYKQRLEKLDHKSFLTPQDHQEKKRLQVAKLAGKTRIEHILMKHR